MLPKLFSRCARLGAPSSRLLRLCDRLVLGGLLFLILFTPLAFGSVHPWATMTMEATIFLLVIVWMAKLLLAPSNAPHSKNAPHFFLPLLLFGSSVLFQLLPLPPSLLHMISPSTYEVYTKTLPGWPEKIPYKNLTIPKSSTNVSNFLENWRPLSLAAKLTTGELLKFLAYCALLGVVFLYPFDVSPHNPHHERGCYRVIVLTVLWSGLLIASIGIVQLYTWNGKLLWFFVPYDVGVPEASMSRASGPFANPNHFANYLGLIFPLSLTGVLAPGAFVAREKTRRFRLVCGGISFMLLMGIVLSLSRGGWLATAVGLGILVSVFLALPPEKQPVLLQGPKKTLAYFLTSGCVLFLAMTLFFVGPSGRDALDTRLERSLIQIAAGGDGRERLWSVSLRMVQDFPVFGVGFGAWSELFPRYEKPPWSMNFAFKAHNDYAQLLAETGLLGFGLLTWFFWMFGKRLIRRLSTLSSKDIPILAALVAGLGATAFHEFWDFSLHVPANAVLFTLCVGCILRVVGAPDGPAVFWPRRYVAGVVLVSCIVLMSVFAQARIPYPYNLADITSVAEAKARIFAYPAHADAHVALFHLRTEIPLDERLSELQIALWFEPYNPEIRDLYAASLIYLGRKEEGLAEMARSVAFAPDHSTHWYFDGQRLLQLSQSEQRAIEAGLQQALAANDEAVEGLGHFYAVLGRFAERGDLFEHAAQKEKDPARLLNYLLNAGHAYRQAEQLQKAEALLRQAIAIAPQDIRPYQFLIAQVFALTGDISAAKEVVETGIKSGADPFVLYLELGKATRRMQEGEEARTAFQEALSLRPNSFQAHAQLGVLYMQEKNFDRAALSLQKAVGIDPNSAWAFYHLGLAEERRYRYLEAEQAYTKAIELAPENSGYQQRWKALLQKIATNIQSDN